MHAMWKPAKFKYIYLLATLYVFTLTLPSAAAMYWAFGDELLSHSNAFSLLPKDGWRDAAVILMLIHQFITFGFACTPLYFVWEKVIGMHDTKSIFKRALARLPVVVPIWFLAIIFPFFGPINSAVGALLVSFTVYIIPSLAHILVYRTASARVVSYKHTCIILLASSSCFILYNRAPALAIEKTVEEIRASFTLTRPPTAWANPQSLNPANNSHINWTQAPPAAPDNPSSAANGSRVDSFCISKPQTRLGPCVSSGSWRSGPAQVSESFLLVPGKRTGSARCAATSARRDGQSVESNRWHTVLLLSGDWVGLAADVRAAGWSTSRRCSDARLGSPGIRWWVTGNETAMETRFPWARDSSAASLSPAFSSNSCPDDNTRERKKEVY
jgi:hypothetical protein